MALCSSFPPRRHPLPFPGRAGCERGGLDSDPSWKKAAPSPPELVQRAEQESVGGAGQEKGWVQLVTGQDMNDQVEMGDPKVSDPCLSLQ